MSAYLYAAAAGLDIFGRIQANLAEAQAERQNSIWMQEQAQFAKKVTERELSITQREQGLFHAQQLDFAASQGLALSGSMLDAINEAGVLANKELAMIKEQGRLQAKEAMLKINAANDRADQLSSVGLNLLQASSSGLKYYSGYKASITPKGA